MKYKILSRETAIKEVCEKYQIAGEYTVLGKEAFKNSIKLKSITMPNIYIIDKQSCFGCTALRKADFPKVLRVGKEAFANCSNLLYASFSDRFIQLEEGAFYKCKRMNQVIFRNNKKCNIIPDEAFAECRQLKEIILPENLEEIGEKAFYKCDSLSQIKLPNSLKIIKDKGFYQCGFTSIMLPEALEYIGESAFLKCKNLEHIKIPKNVKIIKKWAFHGCRNLKVVEFQHDPEYLGEWITNKNCTIRCHKNSVIDEYAKQYEINTEYIELNTKQSLK